MTTVCFDGRILAADGMMIWGSDIVSLNFEKLRPFGGQFYAVAGALTMFDALIAWHKDGAKPDAVPPPTPNGQGWELLVVRDWADNWTWGEVYSSGDQYPVRVRPPVAIGAGQDIAIGAMLAGADAREAVAIVGRRCTHTGGRIMSFDMREFFSSSGEKVAVKGVAK